jgi:hypothetical protein
MNILNADTPDTDKLWYHSAVSVSGVLCLALVLIWIVHRVWAALFIPWWFNTDEVVIYYEAIRQLRLDPSQTFFDIPGTPFMTLTSILTALWWLCERVVGMTHTIGPADFAFANAQGVFALMRILTLGMYVGAGILAYDLFRRCAGALVATVAALLFVSLPIFVQYSYFVRTESMGLVLCLAAIWLILYSRWKGTPAIYAVAGVLAGIAMAARYHFALVGFPVILMVFFLRDREHLPAHEGASGTTLYEVMGTLAALVAAGGLVTLALKMKFIAASGLTNTMLLTTPDGPAQYPGAKAFVANLWLLLGGGALLTLLVHRFPQGRRRIWLAINPFTLLATLGFVSGFILSHPEFLWRGQYQLRSIQFYSDWTDAGLSQLSPLASWWKVTTYYFMTAFPELWTQAFFLAGVVIILWKRRPVHLALAAGAGMCFFGHPLHMKLWPHHVIPWLPFLCFVAAVPVGTVGSWLVQRYRHKRFVSVAIVLLASIIVVSACGARLQHENEYLTVSRSRTVQISAMNQWLVKNVPRDSYLLVSYFALNEDGFRKWIESAGVQVPDFVKKHRDVHIWWLDRPSIDGHVGILCMSRADIAFFRDDFERKQRGSTYNPFDNPNFTPIAHFGGGFYELTVFRFDCMSKKCSL